MRRLLPVALIAAALAVVAPPDARAADRLAGDDRYGTAAAISASAVAANPEFVYVATGEDFPDALASAPVAGTRRTSVLLVTRDTIPDATAQELERLRAGTIYVLGGTGAISDDVVEDLGELAEDEVVRLAGDDRYQTAALVSASYFSPDVAYVYIATGESYADALAAGAAAVDRGPVLLVTRTAIPEATAAELRRLTPQEIIVVGGTSAIDESVEADLAEFTTGPVNRQAGDDRFATSAVVSLGGFQPPTGAVYLANGHAFADALAGGPIAGAADGPVLLTERTCVPERVLVEIERLEPDRVVLLGGSAALADSAGDLTRCGGATPAVIATGLDTPWDVAFEPDGTAYITERNGRLLRMEPGAAPQHLQTIADAQEQGEGGLLGLEIDSDGRLYAYFTTASDNRVARFAPGETPVPILTGIPRASNHDGGRIAFGPDGLLYIGTGDAGDASRAQDPSSLAGKILRIDRDGGIPSGNISATSPVYSLGHRNVQGLAWDRTGRLYAAELGPGENDEVNIIVAGGNYGWGGSGGIAPVVTRDPSVASWSGAAIVDGGVTEWDGDLLVAALRGRRLYRFDRAGDGSIEGAGEELYTGTYGRLRHVEQAPDGSLWVLTSNRDGRGSPTEDDDRIIRIG